MFIIFVTKTDEMPRPSQTRTVQLPPRLKGFMPIGSFSSEHTEIILATEEYEAVRLLDYEGLSQAEASAIMEVSRPTLTRIYSSARKKIATAFTAVLPIRIVGGQITFNGNWLECTGCGSRFNYYGFDNKIDCPLCDCGDVIIINLPKS